MLSHYLDLHLLPDPDFPQGQLMDALFGKLHRELATSGCTEVAVAFPGYICQGRSRELGATLRLLSRAAVLQDLGGLTWLHGMRGLVRAVPVAEVPNSATPRRLLRTQAKSGVERLRRRAMRRHGLTALEAAERVPQSAAETLQLPRLHLRSSSTGQHYPLFLRLEEAECVVPGPFNAFGLSATATVPWF